MYGRSLWSVWISFQSLTHLLEDIQHTVYPDLPLPFRRNTSLDLVMSCILYAVIIFYLFTTAEWMNSKHAWPHASTDSFPTWSQVSEPLKVGSKPFFPLLLLFIQRHQFKGHLLFVGSRIPTTLDLFVSNFALLRIPAGVTGAVASP